MKKKIVNTLVILLILLNFTVSVNATPSQWAEKEVSRAINSNLVPNVLKDDYSNSIKRAEFCSIIVKVYEKITNEEIKELKTFTDTKSLDIMKIGGLGIVNGIGGGKFDPKGLLTREQAATIISKLSKKIGRPLRDGNYLFSDNEKISKWALKEVKQVQTENIMKGVDGNNFNPKGNYTIEQSIVTMARFYDRVISFTVTEESARNSMMALRTKYPEGMRWTNENYYEWNGGIFSGGYGCAGFAFILSDEAFGDTLAKQHNNYDNIKVGDIVRINNDTHSVIIISIDDNTVTLAEGNYGSSIHWGRTMSLTELKQIATHVLTRYI